MGIVKTADNFYSIMCAAWEGVESVWRADFGAGFVSILPGVAENTPGDSWRT
jgi:hypothetical protein